MISSCASGVSPAAVSLSGMRCALGSGSFSSDIASSSESWRAVTLRRMAPLTAKMTTISAAMIRAAIRMVIERGIPALVRRHPGAVR